MCFKGTSKVTSTGYGSSGRKTSQYDPTTHACTDGESS